MYNTLHTLVFYQTLSYSWKHLCFLFSYILRTVWLNKWNSFLVMSYIWTHCLSFLPVFFFFFLNTHPWSSFRGQCNGHTGPLCAPPSFMHSCNEQLDQLSPQQFQWSMQEGVVHNVSFQLFCAGFQSCHELNNFFQFLSFSLFLNLSH